jgi:HlyD family secretion protein
MTATATIAAQERTNVWVVPNSALRFNPEGVNGAGRAASGSDGGIIGKLLPRPPGGLGGRRPGATGTRDAAGGSGRIWVLKNGQPSAITVHKGVSDGRQTEVSGDGLAEGLPVITDQTTNGGHG